MDIIELIILSLLQGLTEFLPISSSAHLILPSQLFGWDDQGLAFDVAVHVGTLLAVIYYFRQEVLTLLSAWFSSLKGKQSAESFLAWLIILAVVPALAIGFFFNDIINNYLRSTFVIACTTIGFGLLLWWADRQPKQDKNEYDLTIKQALFVGVAQALALIPGTSRSGITITAGLMLGLTRTAAARFSFLMSIPTILAAGSYMGLKLVQSQQSVAWGELGLGIVLSFVSAYACIHLFLNIISKMGMLPFVLYRLLLGVVLFAFFV